MSEQTVPEEITFAWLTQLVKEELATNPASNCAAIAEKYGLSQATIDMLIQRLKG